MTKTFLDHLTVEERADCFEFGQLGKRESGSLVIAPGAPAGALFVVLSGTAEVVREDGTNLAMLTPGDVCGEMSLLDGAGASASVRAKSPLTLLILQEGRIDRLVEERPQTAARFYKSLALVLAQRLRATSRMVLTDPGKAPQQPRSMAPKRPWGKE
jgi:CRP-like cAMP-binding protein